MDKVVELGKIRSKYIVLSKEPSGDVGINIGKDLSHEDTLLMISKLLQELRLRHIKTQKH